MTIETTSRSNAPKAGTPEADRNITEAMAAAQQGRKPEFVDKGGNVTELNTDKNVNAKARDADLGLLQDSSRYAADTQRKLFGIMLMCENADVFAGSCLAAERTFVKNVSAAMGPEEIAKFGKIRNIQDVARINGLQKLPAVQMKQTFLSILDHADEHHKAVQDWMDWQHKHMDEPEAVVPEGWLDPWSNRYSHEVRGHQAFMRDYRHSVYCAKRLADAIKAAGKEKSKPIPPGAPAEQVALTPEGMNVNGNRRAGVVLPRAVYQALDSLIKTVHEIHTEIPDGVLAKYLGDVDAAIWADVDARRKQKQADIAAAGNKPSNARKVADESIRQDAERKAKAQAEADAKAKERELAGLPDVDPSAGEFTEEDEARMAEQAPDDGATGTGEDAASRAG